MNTIKPIGKVGLIVNPIAGMGGSVGLKGTDGVDTLAKARARGAEPKAGQRVQFFLQALAENAQAVNWLCAPGLMGEDYLKAMNLPYQVIGELTTDETSADDTKRIAQAMFDEGIDLLVFAGGDGTARNIYEVANHQTAVLGIPAGVKIHSGVYAITPVAAAQIVNMMVKGELLSLFDADVMDIDENAFRAGKVIAKTYGEMLVPQELTFIQSTKSGSKEVEEIVLDDIAAHVIENMDDELYVIGSGSTCAHLMQVMQLDNTLLGVDLVYEQSVLKNDVTEQEVLSAIAEYAKIKLLITVIGGQGHIFGRGNQQLNPAVIRKIGKENIIIIASKTKLKALNGRPLIVDTGDEDLNQELQGYWPVITGYHDEVMVKVGHHADDNN